MKKYTLYNHNPLTYNLCIGIIAPLPTYRVGWLLNTQLGWQLQKKNALTQHDAPIPLYQYQYAQATYTLMQNNALYERKKIYPFPQLKTFSHLLFVQTDEIEQQHVLNTLKTQADLLYISCIEEKLLHPCQLLLQ